MLNDSIAARGSVQIRKYDENNQLVDERNISNIVTAVGKNVIAARLIGNTIPVFSHMAVGTSNVAASVSQTALSVEIARVSLSSSIRSSNTISYAASFPPGTGTGALTEAGIFNAGANGSILCRTTFNEVNKAAGDTIAITWNVTVL